MEIELESRKRIFFFIQDKPGIHFRELQRELDMPVGQLDYHIKYLIDNGMISISEDRYYKRLFPKDFDAREKVMLGAMRQENPRKLVLHLMLEGPCTHSQLLDEFSFAPSTMSFYLSDLVKKDILDREKEGRTSTYSISDPDVVSRVLVMYRQSFVDKLVDRFIEVWFAREERRK